MVNITKITENYIKLHPIIKQALKRKIVNYSKLARNICDERKIENFDAVLMAVRRCNERISKKYSVPVIDLLKGSKISIRSSIAVVILEPDSPFSSIIELQKEVNKQNEILHVIRGPNAIILITTDDFLKKIEMTFKNKILKVSRNLAEIVLKSHIRLESVPGVMGYIYSLFAEDDINIVETLSCWTDTIFVIEIKDLSKTMEILSF